MPEVLLKQIGKQEYEVETPGGVVRFGEGRPGPMTTTAAAVAGCLAMSVSETLEVMRQKVHGIEMRMSYERKKEEPKIFDGFNVHRIFRGEGLSSSRIERGASPSGREDMSDEPHDEARLSGSENNLLDRRDNTRP